MGPKPKHKPEEPEVQEGCARVYRMSGFPEIPLCRLGGGEGGTHFTSSTGFGGGGGGGDGAMGLED